MWVFLNTVKWNLSLISSDSLLVALFLPTVGAFNWIQPNTRQVRWIQAVTNKRKKKKKMNARIVVSPSMVPFECCLSLSTALNAIIVCHCQSIIVPPKPRISATGRGSSLTIADSKERLIQNSGQSHLLFRELNQELCVTFLCPGSRIVR